MAGRAEGALADEVPHLRRAELLVEALGEQQLGEHHRGGVLVGAVVHHFAPRVLGRLQAGEELQDPTALNKAELSFPSGESLPRCWLDPHYTS